MTPLRGIDPDVLRVIRDGDCDTAAVIDAQLVMIRCDQRDMREKMETELKMLHAKIDTLSTADLGRTSQLEGWRAFAAGILALAMWLAMFFAPEVRGQLGLPAVQVHGEVPEIGRRRP